MSNRILTEQDLHNIVYYALERRDIDSWDGWEAIKDAVKHLHPLVFKVVEDVRLSHAMLEVVVFDLKNKID